MRVNIAACESLIFGLIFPFTKSMATVEQAVSVMLESVETEAEIKRTSTMPIRILDSPAMFSILGMM